MNRFDIINRIGDKYRVGNTETGEFSYAQALKTVGKDIKDYQKATTGTQHITFTDVDGNMFGYEVIELETLSPFAIEEMTGGNWDLTLFTCTVGGQYRVTARCVLANGGA